MNKSESIALLAEALSKAQGEMVSAKKDADNPFFKSKYSDLASVYDACRAPLAKHGLSIVQAPTFDESGRVGMHSLIMHSSGEWIEPPMMLMKPTKDDPQGFGSVITYLRRYCLSALVGISSELDDDGNSASGKSSKVTETPIVIGKPKPSEGLMPFSKNLVAGEPIWGGPASSSESVGTDSKAAPIISDDELSDVHQQNKFAAEYRKALPEKFRPHSEQLRHAALEDEGYKSSKDILKKDFAKVANRIIKAAREMKDPFIPSDDDLPENI